MIAKRALTMERDCRSILSERATLDPFETLAGETPPLQNDLMERQPSSLTNAPIVRRARDTQLHVSSVPEDGMATNWVRIR